jgi:hypothetical protein
MSLASVTVLPEKLSRAGLPPHVPLTILPDYPRVQDISAVIAKKSFDKTAFPSLQSHFATCGTIIACFLVTDTRTGHAVFKDEAAETSTFKEETLNVYHAYRRLHR